MPRKLSEDLRKPFLRKAIHAVSSPKDLIKPQGKQAVQILSLWKS